jgi:hypothetical protein
LASNLDLQELIDFGNKLLKKGRTSTEVFNALAIRTSSKEVLNAALKKVNQPDKPLVQRKKSDIKKLLAANKKQLNFKYSLRTLLMIPFLILCTGGIVLFLSNEKVNGNSEFGYLTLLQGTIIFLLYALAKYKKMYHLFIICIFTFGVIWIIEVLVFGIPNDLLEAANHVKIRVPHGYQQRMNMGGARFLGYIFPYLYVGIKLLLGTLVFIVYRNHLSYDALDEKTKADLKDFAAK